MTLLEHFMAPEAQPFAVAAVMILVIGLTEVATMLVGFSLSELVGKAIDFDSHPDHGLLNVISWLNVGGVPLLIFVLLFLGMFAMSGFVIQEAAWSLGGPLPAFVAAPLAFLAALPLVRWSTDLVGGIIPQDESYAVELTDLVGRIGEVVVGPLDHGLPGRVRLKDVHGNVHFVSASAAPESDPLPQGATVLLVDREDTRFVAIGAPVDLASSTVSGNS
ncbi:DUF1449 family protein [Mesorhizobium sp. BAC0120]|uniref:OB-fold-containig protein n=1 Tax=Mesorhizobium sp. BAC0120 TaxID=3090670 RepID=UPI00298C0FF2|nr:OB-fold-containig protein [Mesorhizobium sp. BAC0120]MDW6023094.1 DUF1449 family protein [Mesorhizobium sp. BAC0120]